MATTDTKAPKAEPKYKALSANFMNGTFAGQLSSVYRDRETNADKANDFKAAIKAGDIKVDSEITSQMASKLGELGITVPSTTTVKQRGAVAATGTEG